MKVELRMRAKRRSEATNAVFIFVSVVVRAQMAREKWGVWGLKVAGDCVLFIEEKDVLCLGVGRIITVKREKTKMRCKITQFKINFP